MNAARIVAAAKEYAATLRAAGRSVPRSVPLKALIENGLLRKQDVKGFAGMEVTVSLSVDEKNPGAVLARARLPDGSEAVALADGGIQESER